MKRLLPCCLKIKSFLEKSNTRNSLMTQYTVSSTFWIFSYRLRSEDFLTCITSVLGELLSREGFPLSSSRERVSVWIYFTWLLARFFSRPCLGTPATCLPSQRPTSLKKNSSKGCTQQQHLVPPKITFFIISFSWLKSRFWRHFLLEKEKLIHPCPAMCYIEVDLRRRRNHLEKRWRMNNVFRKFSMVLITAETGGIFRSFSRAKRERRYSGHGDRKK